MTKNHISLPLLFTLIFCLMTGCASQQAKVQDADNAKLPLKSPELLIAGTENVEIKSEDEKLLLDDLDDTLDDDLDDDEDIYMVADPLERINRVTFYLNDKLYFWFLKPIATGYRAVVPTPVRSGVKNFFNNLGAPIRLVNNILQGKGQAAEAELAKFLYNSTVGVLGFGNPAKGNAALNPPSEDAGQTLAKYGIGDGFFLMLPIFGPSTLRDSVGMFGDGYLNPATYVTPIEASYAIKGYREVNNISFRLGDYESLKKAALDPYEALRNGYLQSRQVKIKE